MGHIVSKEGIAMDPDKVRAILEAPDPTNAKSLSRFLGQIRWHSRMIRYLADLATPLHAIVHKEPFTWGEEEDKAFLSLKILLSASTSRTTPGLGQGIPRVRGCFGSSNR